MNSLKIKILGLTTLIMVVAVGLTAWHNLRAQKAMIERTAHQQGRILRETILNSVATDMANGQNQKVSTILAKILKEPAIQAVRIFDESGHILNSGDLHEVGELVSPGELLAVRSRSYEGFDLCPENNCYTTIVAIENAPACYICHDSSRKVLGVLSVHFSMDSLLALQNEGRKATFASSAIMLTILILTISVFIIIYVDSPIRKLVQAMNFVEHGNFAKSYISIKSSDEMALLSTKFNAMVEKLKSLIQTTVENEREIAIAQEKLAHHDELTDMNILLEERIEEIEDANYKIADLASELEDKNRNLEQAIEGLSILYKVGVAINSTMELNAQFSLLTKKTTEILKAEAGYILLFDKDTTALKLSAVAGLPDEIEPGIHLNLNRGDISHWVIENRQSLLIQDIDQARNFNKKSHLGIKKKTVICAPLTIQDEIIGTITIANKQDKTSFTSDDLKLLTTIATQASVAINSARLYKEQETTYLSTVQALVSAIEASDPYTKGHSERVTQYSLLLAKHLGLESSSLKKLKQAASLHDIGKIGIGASLLHKKGSLSAEDIDILQKHPTIGVKILEPIHFLEDVRKIIEQHHERFDGKGYPNKISGENILIEARILAVADAYDAMTSDRPYRKALSVETAIREIEKHARSQFDPHVARAFIDLYQNENLNIHEPAILASMSRL